MPYFIEQGRADCNGWATVKDDGALIGCHTTKAAAIAQMVAVSLAEDMPPGGERDSYEPKPRAIVYSLEAVRDAGQPVPYVIDHVRTLNQSGAVAVMVSGLGSEALTEALAFAEEQGLPVQGSYFQEGSGDRTAFLLTVAEEIRDSFDIVEWIDPDLLLLNALTELGIRVATPGTFRSLEPRDLGDPPVVVSDVDDTIRHESGTAIGYMAEHLRNVKAQGTGVVIVTGNPAYTVDELAAWMDDNNIPHDLIVISEGGDPNSFKLAVAERLLDEYNVIDWIDNNPDLRTALAELGILAHGPSAYRVAPVELEERATAPGYMRRAARRGLAYVEQGRGGDGLTAQTLEEARLMAGGTISDNKIVRANAWAARHAVDLEADQNSDPSSDSFPGAGAVAFYLWGIDPLNPEPALAWLARETERIQGESRAMSKIETRSFDLELLEVRAIGDGMTFSGYAAVFNSPSEPLPWIETIAEGAFTRTLTKSNNVRMLVNHNPEKVLGSTRAKTLRLSQDSTGLRAEADLPDTSYARDLSVSMQRGDINSMSFGFSVPRGGDVWSSDGSQRTLKEVRLHEVSVVTFPAFPRTSAQVRSVDILADKTGEDADLLQVALDRLEAGQPLSMDQAELLGAVVAKLTPEPPVTEPTEPVTDTNLELLRKQLDLAYLAL
jgi:uncharacterized protein